MVAMECVQYRKILLSANHCLQDFSRRQWELTLAIDGIKTHTRVPE